MVLIGGSGPSDRHNDGFFDLIRDHLPAAGVAVLAYDKRGAGTSTGAWAGATVDDLARDAAAAVAVLRSHPGVAADDVGVLGHSEGGWVALRLAAGHDALAHLVLNSCPAVSFAESEVFAYTVAGASPDAAATLMRRLATAVRAGHDYREGQRVLASCAGEPWYPLLTADGFTMDEVAWAQLAAWADYDPAEDLARLTVPTLAIFGADDPLVPVEASVQRYEETAARAGRFQQTRVFPGANHRLQTGDGIAPGYLAQVADWCKRR